MKWTNLFEKHILERGIMYYWEDCVENLEVDAGEITAVVKGSEQYDVTIKLNKNDISDMTCTCPYAETGENCKHMAAVLYAWQNAGKQPQNTEMEIKEAVEHTDVEKLRKFLTSVLVQNEKLWRKFIMETKPDSAPVVLEEIEAEIAAIIDCYMEDDYIHYREASSFISELFNILEDEAIPRMEHGQLRDAFLISTLVFLTLNDVEMDDSDGGMSVIASTCRSMWETIINQADDELQQEIYDWLTEHSRGVIVDYLEDCCLDALMHCFSAPKYTKELLAMKQSLLDQALCGGNSSYLVERYARNCIQLMEKQKESVDVLDVWCRRYQSIPCVRDAMIERHQQAGKWEEVVELLKEAIEQSNGLFGSRYGYHMQLKNAYAALGWKDEYRDELWKIVTEISPGDMDAYHEYRNLFETEAWPAERERLFASLPQQTSMAALYADEGLYDRLLKCVVKSPRIYLLKQYEDVLVKQYPEQVLKKYAETINADARNVADRTIYREWVSTLKHMRKIPGGESVVDEMPRHGAPNIGAARR